MVLNSLFFILREYFANLKIDWLQNNWQSLLIATYLLFISFLSIEILIFNFNIHHLINYIAAAVGSLVQLCIFSYFRNYKTNIWGISLSSISLALILCSIFYKLISIVTSNESIQWIMMLVSALIIFALGAYIVNSYAKKIKIINKVIAE